MENIYYYRFESGEDSRRPTHVAITVQADSLDAGLKVANRVLSAKTVVQVPTDELDNVIGFSVYFSGTLSADDLTETDDPQHL
jgi:hypothetical protein